MNIYFNDINTLHRFTLELDGQPHAVKCKHCAKDNQFVSHGFVYKKQHHGDKQPVGKRLFCSNRFGKSGCGRTCQLYLAAHIPTWHYAAQHLFVFLSGLITGCSIQKAYYQATTTADPRHAYRWLNKLDQRLMIFRLFLKRPLINDHPAFNTRTKRLRLLLPTLHQIFLLTGKHLCACASYQFIQQTAFA